MPCVPVITYEKSQIGNKIGKVNIEVSLALILHNHNPWIIPIAPQYHHSSVVCRLTKEFIRKATHPHPCPLPSRERGLKNRPSLEGRG